MQVLSNLAFEEVDVEEVEVEVKEEETEEVDVEEVEVELEEEYKGLFLKKLRYLRWRLP